MCVRVFSLTRVKLSVYYTHSHYISLFLYLLYVFYFVFFIFNFNHLHHHTCPNPLYKQNYCAKYTRPSTHQSSPPQPPNHTISENIYYRCGWLTGGLCHRICKSFVVARRLTLPKVNESVMPCTISLRTRSIAMPTGTAEAETPIGNRSDPGRYTPRPTTGPTRRPRGHPDAAGPAMRSTTKTSRTVSSATSVRQLPARRTPPRPLYIIVVALVSSPRQRIPAVAASSWATVGTCHRRWPQGTASSDHRTT